MNAKSLTLNLPLTSPFISLILLTILLQLFLILIHLFIWTGGCEGTHVHERKYATVWRKQLFWISARNSDALQSFCFGDIKVSVGSLFLRAFEESRITCEKLVM